MKRLAFAMIALAACGGGDEVDPADQEACLHLDNGPFQELEAGATRDSSAPEIDDDHVTYTVSGDGFAVIGIGEAGDYLFFFDADVPVEYTDSRGDVVTPEESATRSEACAAIARRDLVPLTVGTTYLELSGNDATSIVIEAAEHED